MSGTLHVWQLGPGVIVEVRSTKPLTPEHCDLFRRYVELAREAAGAAASDDDDEPIGRLPPLALARYVGRADACDGEDPRTTGAEVAADCDIKDADPKLQAELLAEYTQAYQARLARMPQRRREREGKK